MSEPKWNVELVSVARMNGDAAIADIRGEIDLHNSPAVLVEALQKLRPTGGRVMLVDLQPRVKGLLQIARLDSIFILADSEQQALTM